MHLSILKIEFVKIIVFFSVFMIAPFTYAYTLNDENSIRFIYIPDLNLYPTPSLSKTEKPLQEKKYGLLIYESQAIFQDLIRYLNQKFDFDLVIFGGNNISEIQKDFRMLHSDESIWNLFLDMVNEIKTDFLVVLGENELHSKARNALFQMLKSFGQNSENTWWLYRKKNFLFIGLDSDLLLNNTLLAKTQLKWLNDVLNNNKDTITFIFMHKPLLYPDGKIIENNYVNEYFKIINKYYQVKLIFSSGIYLNRIKIFNNFVYVISSGPTSYPCTFKLIEVSTSKLKIKTINIPLKGIIKKSEKSLIDSQWANTLFPSSPKSIKKHVLGINSDSNLEFGFDLRNR